MVDKKARILIVDDQSFNIDALQVILKYSIGIDSEICDKANNGEQALNMVKKDVDENNRGLFCSYDLIFMDCNMPFMDGYDATTAIREFLFEKKIRQPIISAITGHTEQSYVNRAINSGMN